MSTPIDSFRHERHERIQAQAHNQRLQQAAREFLYASIEARYSYNFSWLDRPIIQYPQDMLALQEIVWCTRPDLIIETGIAHGGSLVYSASLLQLLGQGQVLGIDIDIRSHNRQAIEAHPLAHRIELLQGSSVDPDIVQQVRQRAQGKERVMVILDSNHTHQHVLEELHLYAPLVSAGQYLVVFDTIVEDLADWGMDFPDRPWGKGNNPKTAVWEFLGTHPEFEIDQLMDHKLLISVAPQGYLRKR